MKRLPTRPISEVAPPPRRFPLTKLRGERVELDPSIERDARNAYYEVTLRGKRRPDLEEVIRKSPEHAYLYAQNIIKDKWPDGEKTILDHMDPEWIFKYAKNVIKHLSRLDRWPEGEKALLTAGDPSWIYKYAAEVIEGEWPEGESIIRQHPQFAYLYAANVRHKRWPQAEPIIMRRPSAAYHYAVYVIGDTWPEAEGIMANDPFVWPKYQNFQQLLRAGEGVFEPGAAEVLQVAEAITDHPDIFTS